jgi:hypothetical protein
MEIARQEDIDPAEALLGLVKTAMGRSAYVDGVLTQALRRHVDEGGNPLEPPDKIRKWMNESRMERTLAARTAQMAVGAGVMQAMERRLDMEGSLVADAVASALDSLDLTAEDRSKAFGAAQERLLELE